MKKVIAMLLTVLMVMSVSAFAATPSITTADLAANSSPSITADDLTQVEILVPGIVRIALTETAEEILAEAVATSVKDVFGVEGELEALISFNVFENAEAGEIIIDTLAELTEEDEITILLGLTVADATEWLPVEFVLAEGMIAVTISEEQVEAAKLADAVTMAIIVA